EDTLAPNAADRAREFVKAQKRRVAVMVNRLATAGQVAAALNESRGEEYEVVLLTGRLRPFERDHIVQRWKPFLKASAPEDPERPIIVVTTQCLEVGADF